MNEISIGDNVRVHTLGSRYDNNSVAVRVDGKEFRLHSLEIAKLMKGREFKSKKARVHEYLEVA